MDKKKFLVLLLLTIISFLFSTENDSLAYFKKIQSPKKKNRELIPYLYRKLENRNFIPEQSLLNNLISYNKNRNIIQYSELVALKYYYHAEAKTYQTMSLDTLYLAYAALKEAKKEKAAGLTALTLGYFFSKKEMYEETIKYAKESFLLLQDSEIRFASLLLQAGSFYSMQNIASSFVLYEEVIQNTKVPEYLFEAKGNIANIYIYKGNFDDALAMQKSALESAKEFDSFQLDKIYANIGVSYYYLEDYNQCLSYLLKANDYYRKNNENYKLSKYAVNIALCKMELGKENEAYALLDSALFDAQKNRDKREEAQVLYNYGEILRGEDASKAEQYLILAREIAISSNLKEIAMYSIQGLSLLYYELKKFESGYMLNREYGMFLQADLQKQKFHMLALEKEKEEVSSMLAKMSKEYETQSNALMEQKNQKSFLSYGIAITAAILLSLLLIIVIRILKHRKIKVKIRDKRILNSELSTLNKILEKEHIEITEVIKTQKRTAEEVLVLLKAQSQNALNVTLNHELNQHLHIMLNNLEMITMLDDSKSIREIVEEFTKTIHTIAEEIRLDES